MPKFKDFVRNATEQTTLTGNERIPLVDEDGSGATEYVEYDTIQAANDSRYAPLAVDQFVDPFPAWFGGGTVNESIADVVTHADAYTKVGSGPPNSSVVGNVGDRYIDTAATLGARVWHKASGAATNTGWLVSEGDTGWRNIAASLTPEAGVSFVRAHVRRVNENIMFSFDVTHGSSTSVKLSQKAMSTVLVDGLRPMPTAAAVLSMAASAGGGVTAGGVGMLKWHSTTDAQGLQMIHSSAVSGLICVVSLPAGSTTWPASLPPAA